VVVWNEEPEEGPLPLRRHRGAQTPGNLHAKFKGKLRINVHPVFDIVIYGAERGRSKGENCGVSKVCLRDNASPWVDVHLRLSFIVGLSERGGTRNGPSERVTVLVPPLHPKSTKILLSIRTGNGICTSTPS
jgi:hypothetical protein